MTESRVWESVAWCTVAVACVACAPKPITGEDATSSTGGVSSTEASGAEDSPETSSDGTTDSADESTSGGSAAGCPGGDAELTLDLSLPDPDPPPNPEADSDQREATCLVDDASMEGQQLVVAMTCDEVGGPTQQPYELGLTLPDGERVALTTGQTVDVSWYHWWGFEVGSGRRLEISGAGNSLLRVYTEGKGGMSEGNCWDPETQDWMDVIGGTLVEGGCDDRVTLKLDLGDGVALFPGQMALLPAGDRKVLVDEATCRMYGSTDDWLIKVADWVPG